ncbi:unnamed protein product [Symbiodinium sp. KB8]|nr:unnamed protein product [Symbiodinium sp. KB8]
MDLAARVANLHRGPLKRHSWPEVMESPASADPFDPSCDVLPNLLPYLSVDDILERRATSCQTRSPRALLQHVSEMGRLDRSETVVEISANWQFGAEDPFTFDDEISKDVMQRKIFSATGGA